ncbi:hypothetical protein [Afifella sp. IM 167]|uniref:hypothetical protein n=1 Tax=Afifella sp. IM 167 TaxID=2033586 RepID=UPI001CCCDFB6|nr:hypothetical protein [Afifella sp. IM 167]
MLGSCLFSAAAMAQGEVPVGKANLVSYEDLLANPDDLALNYAYARQQAESGQLEQAAGALERLLLLQPNWDELRLFYAVVLYRLDDLKGAERELLILQERPLGAGAANEVARYLALVRAGDRSTRLTGSVSVGGSIDSNPSFASSADTGFTAGTLVPLTAKERVDGAFNAAIDMRLEHVLANGRGDLLFVEGSGWLNEQFDVGEASFVTGHGRAGATFHFRDLAVTPSARFGAYALDGELFYTEYGPSLAATYRINPHLNAFAEFAALWQDYDRTSYSTVGSARDGWLLKGGGGLTGRPVPWLTVTGDAYLLNKNASSGSYSYDGVELHARDLILLGKGQYVTADVWYWRIVYDRPDTAVLPGVTREDDRYRARLAYGLPLSTIAEAAGGTLPDAIGQVNLQVGGEYYLQQSNISNYDGDNWSGDVLVTKRFAF